MSITRFLCLGPADDMDDLPGGRGQDRRLLGGLMSLMQPRGMGRIMSIGQGAAARPDLEVSMRPIPGSFFFLVVAAMTLPFGSAFSQGGKLISVPSDPGTRYWAVEGSRPSPTTVEILTRREGRSGSSYSVRLIDCATWQFRYSGEGKTPEEAKARKSKPAQMSPLTKGSVETDIADYACGNVR